MIVNTKIKVKEKEKEKVTKKIKRVHQEKLMGVKKKPMIRIPTTTTKMLTRARKKKNTKFTHD